jgi:ribose transport system substrate-binding protein
LSFPCGLNEGTQTICNGAKAAGAHLPPGYKFEIKTGVNYADNQAFNNLIQTSLQLHPAGLIVFPAGPAAQTPVLNQACDQGTKIIILDSPATGVKCQASLVGANHYQLGAIVGQWLAKHPAPSKQVGIVTQPPGEYASTDNRVKGFTHAAEIAGYKVVATAITNLSLDQTRTGVTNMLTAHPAIGAIFSGNGPMGQGTAQALRHNRNVMQLTLDFDSADVAALVNGGLAAVGDQHPYYEGLYAVQTMVKVLQGQKVAPEVFTPLSVVDKSNAKNTNPAL